MSDNSSDIGAFFAGLLIGGLVGAAVSLLLAPQSGEETRVMIRDKSIELKDMAVETGQDARIRAEKALEDARVRADAAVLDLRARTDDLTRMTKEKASGMRQSGGAAAPVEVEEAVEDAADAAADAAAA